MRRMLLSFSCLALALVPGCAWFGPGPAPSVTLVGQLAVSEGSTRTQALVQRNTKAQIKSLTLDFYTVQGGTARPLVLKGATQSLTVNRGDLDGTFKLAGLAPSTTYRIKALARNDQNQIISSQDSRSETDVAIALDDQVAATIKVQLTDVLFSATASGTFAVTPGGLTDPTDPVGVTLQ